MLSALVFLLLSIALGFGLVERLHFFNAPFENFAFGVPVGIAVSSFIVLGLYALWRGFSDAVFYASLVIISILILFLYRKELMARRFAIRKTKASGLPKTVLHSILLVYGIIAFVLLTSLYTYGGALYCLGPSICSDLLYHIGVGNSVIYSGFPPKYPFTIGAINVFPFINDFYTALLMRYGLGLVPATLIPDLLLFFSAVVATTMLAYAILKNKFAALAAMLVFWFGSDFMMAFILYPLQSALPFIPNNLAPLSYFVSNYGVGTTGLAAILASSISIVSGWTSILYQNLLPQRGFDLALPLGVFLIYFAYQLLFAKRKFSRSQLLLIGIAAGMMPLIHPITLVVLLFVAVYVAVKLLADKKRRKELLALTVYVLIPAAILILPQVVFMTSQPPVPGRYHFVYSGFYRTGADMATILSNLVSVPSFWIDLVGLPLILAIAGYALAGREARSFALPFFAVWIMLTIFSFELDSSDGEKFFIYVLLMLCILGGYVFMNLYRRRALWKTVAVVLVLANIANFPAMYGYWLMHPLGWLGSAEINASIFAMRNTSSSSLFAVSDSSSLMQTIPSLGGRQALISLFPYVEIDEYTYQLQQLLSENARIFGSGNCTLIRSLNVSYVYLFSNSTNDTVPFANPNFLQVFSQSYPQKSANIYIYKVLC